MKRDLEIAREIQNWLMPATPPAVPGADIAFESRAATPLLAITTTFFFVHQIPREPRLSPNGCSS